MEWKIIVLSVSYDAIKWSLICRCNIDAFVNNFHSNQISRINRPVVNVIVMYYYIVRSLIKYLMFSGVLVCLMETSNGWFSRSTYIETEQDI